MYNKTLMAGAVASALAVATPIAQAADREVASYQVDTEVKILSDQRTRGISDSVMKPALKLGVEVAHESGMVAIANIVNVSRKAFPDGNGTDITAGAGYRFGNPEGWHFGVGVAAEIFPGAKVSAPHELAVDDGTVTGMAGALYPSGFRDTNFNSQFAVLEISFGKLEGRILDVISKNYRGADTGTVCGSFLFGMSDLDAVMAVNDPSSKASQCYARGDKNSRGSLLYDLDYKIGIAPATTLILHAGYQKVKNFSEADFTDYSVGVTHKRWGFEWAAEYVQTQTKAAELYMVQDGDKVRRLDNDRLILSVSRKF
jgi:hypothetical protein